MEKKRSRLWTKDFTIITIGSIISYFGNSVAGYAMGLLTLDSTDSVLLFSLVMVIYSLPKVVTPLLIGPFLDRFSRRKVIYTLDFTSCGLYLLLSLLMYKNWYNYVVVTAFAAVAGTIDAVYQTAYESFYPSLITEGNYRRAYSVSSLMYPIASMIMVPVTAVFYTTVGLAPLFVMNSATFFVAAVMETRIVGNETHIKAERRHMDLRAYREDFREGIEYLRQERGLATITAYFLVSMLTGAVVGTVTLPYFKGISTVEALNPIFPGLFELSFFKTGEALGVLAYSLLSSLNTVGRLIGGLLQYVVRYPTQKKYGIAVMVYLVAGVLDCAYLYVPYEIMLLMMFTCGFLAVNSYNIRISATQNYVADSKRGRFNGIFMMINMAGSLMGNLIGGILGEFVADLRLIAVGAMAVNIVCVFAIFVRNSRYVKPIYNMELN